MRKTKLNPLFSILLIFAFLLTGCGKSGPTWEDVAVQTSHLSSEWDQIKPRIQNALSEEITQAGKYPASYTQVLAEDKIRAVDAVHVLGDETQGLIHDLKAMVNDESENRDIQQALDLIGKIQPALQSAVVYPNRVLGSPGKPENGLYVVLAKKVKLYNEGYDPADGKSLLEEVKVLDVEVFAAINVAKKSEKFYLCGDKDHPVTYSSADALYGSGLVQIKSAETKIGEGDLPAASDLLAQAQSNLDAAKSSASGARQTNKDTVTVINNAIKAQGPAATADKNWLLDYWSEVDQQYKKGNQALESAYTSCYAENFAQAQIDANSAKAAFDKAVWYSTQEKSETVIIVNTTTEDDDDDTETTTPIFTFPADDTNTTPAYEYPDDGGVDLSDDGWIDLSDDGGIDIGDDGGL